MKTKLLKVEENNENIQEAATLLKRGEVVAFPTETVYGLGADATNEQAVAKIFTAKGRPSDNPLIVHVASKEQLLELVTDVPDYVERLIDTFSPGPITYVLKSKGKVAANVTAGLNTVAVRIPNHDIALSLLTACELPIAAPSANISGRPSPTSATHVLDDLDGKIAAVLDGGTSQVGVESTVVDCTGAEPVILRRGKITEEDIEKVINVNEVEIYDRQVEKPKSPGLKYKHYAPEIPLYLIESDITIQVVIDAEKRKGNRVGALVSAATAKKISADKIVAVGIDEEEIAKNLYEALRSFKKVEVDVIVCESFPAKEVGKAVMDRICKAASRTI